VILAFLSRQPGARSRTRRGNRNRLTSAQLECRDVPLEIAGMLDAKPPDFIRSWRTPGTNVSSGVKHDTRAATHQVIDRIDERPLGNPTQIDAQSSRQADCAGRLVQLDIQHGAGPIFRIGVLVQTISGVPSHLDKTAIVSRSLERGQDPWIESPTGRNISLAGIGNDTQEIA